MLKLAKPSGKIKDFIEKVSYGQWMAAAVCVSFLLGLIIYFSLSGLDEDKKNAANSNMVQVVVAKQDIPAREIITAEMLKVVDVPVDILPPGAATDISSITNCPASVPIQQGDIVTDKKVLMDIKMAGFTGMIPPDCRAITIGVSDTTGVAGFAKPGDYVDVMIIRGKKESGKISGEILMQNVLLLALNKNSVDAAGDGSKSGSESATTATLALTAEEALKLAVEMQDGSVYLVLRPYHPMNRFIINTEYFKLTDTERKDNTPAPSAMSMPAPSQPAPAYTAPAQPTPAPKAESAPATGTGNTIEIIRGTTSSTVEVK